MTRQFRRALIALALVTIAFGLWATLVKAHHDIVQLSPGETYHGQVTLPNLQNIQLEGSGWRLHIDGCGGPLGHNNYLCAAGLRNYRITAPSEHLKVGHLKTGGNLRVAFLSSSIMEAYFRYKTGNCPSDYEPALTARKGEAGYTPEAKYVCTNHPDFEGE